MGEPTVSIAAANYHNFDNSNYTLLGCDVGFSNSNGSIGGFYGIGTNYNNQPDLVIDLKGTYKYNDSLNSNVRLRTKFGENNTVQLRISPLSTSFKIGKDTSIYTNLNDCITYKSNTGKVTNQINCFAGISHKIGNTSVWVEGELDDLYRNPFQKSKLGVNAGVTVKF